MKMNFVSTTSEIEQFSSKIEETKEKIRLLDCVAGSLISGLLFTAVIIFPILAHCA